MRKKIPVEQLRLGMHIHEFCGSLLNHPFWRSKFSLTEANELQSVKTSGMTHCWIDTDRGLDVAAPVKPEIAPASAPARAAPAAVAAPREQVDISVEVKQAAALCKRSKQAVVDMFSQARMGLVVNSESCLPLVEDISNSVSRNAAALISLARLKTHDDYSYMHSVAVCALMIALARQLGLNEEQTREAGMAGLLHDLGKALMPPEVLNKPGKLTDDEFNLIKTHPERGHELLLQSGTVGDMAAMFVCITTKRLMAAATHTDLLVSRSHCTRKWELCAMSMMRSRRTGPTERLGPRRFDRQNGRMAQGTFRRGCVPSLYQEPGDLPDGLAGATEVGPASDCG